jgi:hypothetical protein
MNENDDKPPIEPNTNEGEDSSLENAPKENAEPLYQQAIDDLRTWSEQQDSPGLLRGALSHLEASLEQRRKQ